MRVESRRAALLAVVGVLPWTVLVGRAGLDLVFLWGLMNPTSGHVVGLPAYLFVHTGGLPDRLLAWPVSTLLFLAGGVAALSENRWHSDPRLTAGLLGLAGLGHLAFSVGLARRGASTVLPLGPAVAVGLAWWFHAAGQPADGRRER